VVGGVYVERIEAHADRSMKPATSISQRRVVLTANQAWNLYNFRRGLIRRLLAEGYEVVTVAPPDACSPRLRALGCRAIDLEMSGRGTNPLENLVLLGRLTRIYRQLLPEIVFHYTIKPNILGSIAAAIARVPSVAVITGLGYTFLSRSVIARFAMGLYRFALSFPAQVWFLNVHDQREFIEARFVESAKTVVLPGEGIDTEYYTPDGCRPDDGSFRFLMIARLLWDKGVREFVDAAVQVRSKFPETKFQLLGESDAANPSAIGARQVQEWQDAGAIEYLGAAEDVRPYVATADCVVLPSYREGMSRVLLEAASMARPIIATDVPGCRETVDDQRTGYLCKVADSVDLASKMEEMLKLSSDTRIAMGRAGRIKIQSEFDERIVGDKYLQTLFDIARTKRRS